MYGPFSRSYTTPYNGQSQDWRSVVYYKQKVPYKLRLPVESHFNQWRRIPNPWWSSDSASSYGSSIFTNDPYFSSNYAKAYEMFKSGLNEQVNLAVNFAERTQTINMMASRFSQIYRFSRSIARFRFDEAADALGLRHGRQRDFSRNRSSLLVEGRELRFKRKAKSFGNNYLEFHFGWEPLLKDIHGAGEILLSPPVKGNLVRLKGRASQFGPASHTPPPMPAIGNYAYSLIWKWSKCQILSDAVISDPNVVAYNQWGLLNPAVVAWELVPFSFVADWFTNVGQVLSSYTDFAGVTFSNGATSQLVCVSRKAYYRGYKVPPDYGPFWEYTQVSLKRTLGVSTPKFALRQLKLPSVTRALTACSLLTLGLKGHR